MKLLYYASYVLSAPFYSMSWILYGTSWLFQFVGDAIHDQTTYRAWRVLHIRACRRTPPARGTHE